MQQHQFFACQVVWLGKGILCTSKHNYGTCVSRPGLIEQCFPFPLTLVSVRSSSNVTAGLSRFALSLSVDSGAHVFVTECDTLLWRQVRSSLATHAGVHLQAWMFDMVRPHTELCVSRGDGDQRPDRTSNHCHLSRCEPCFSSRLDSPCSSCGHPDQILGTRHDGYLLDR